MNQRSCISLQKSTGRNESYTSWCLRGTNQNVSGLLAQLQMQISKSMMDFIVCPDRGSGRFQQSDIAHDQTKPVAHQAFGGQESQKVFHPPKTNKKKKNLVGICTYLVIFENTQDTREPGRLLSKVCDELTAQERSAHAPLNNRFPLFLR